KAFAVTLTVSVDENVPRTVRLDAEKIAWATTALVGNALRYVRHGSTVMAGGVIGVSVTFDAANARITIAVEDDGPGIAAHRLPTLLGGPWDQPRAGVALVIVRDVVEAP